MLLLQAVKVIHLVIPVQPVPQKIPIPCPYAASFGGQGQTLVQRSDFNLFLLEILQAQKEQYCQRHGG